MKSMLLRGYCSVCGKFGVVRRDGMMWTHICLKGRHACPPASNVQTFQRRVEQLVDALLPTNASVERRAEAIAMVSKVFDQEADSRLSPGRER